MYVLVIDVAYKMVMMLLMLLMLVLLVMLLMLLMSLIIFRAKLHSQV